MSNETAGMCERIFIHKKTTKKPNYISVLHGPYYEKSMVRTVHGTNNLWYEKSMVRKSSNPRNWRDPIEILSLIMHYISQ